jgi:hypothetical protein
MHHDWNLEKNLICLVYEALPENGAFVVIENIIDDDRRKNAFGFLMSLHMLIEFRDTFVFYWSRLLGMVPRSRV